MENSIKMDDLGGKNTYFWKHPCMSLPLFLLPVEKLQFHSTGEKKTRFFFKSQSHMLHVTGIFTLPDDSIKVTKLYPQNVGLVTNKL